MTDIFSLNTLSPQQQGTNLLKIKKKGIQEVSLEIKRMQDIDEQINKLAQVLDNQEKSKIKLIMDTGLENDTAAEKFIMSLEKLDIQKIDYLIWHIHGEIKSGITQMLGEKTPSMIGDLISRFINLYSLNLSIYQLQEKDALSLSRSFEKLKNLNILELDLPQYFISSECLKIILKAIEKIKKLEILNFNLDEYEYDEQWWKQEITEVEADPKVNDSLNNLSVFIYEIDIRKSSFSKKFSKSEQEQRLNKLKENFHKNKNLISNLIFLPYVDIDDGINYYKEEVDQTFYLKSLTECFLLPYLTSFNDKTRYQILKVPIQQLLKAFSEEKMMKIMQMIAFYFEVSQFCPFNPHWALNDLYFD